MQDALQSYLLRLGDNTLILGQRLSEWCGHAPALEEDIALANVTLDLIGQTQLWLGAADRSTALKKLRMILHFIEKSMIFTTC